MASPRAHPRRAPSDSPRPPCALRPGNPGIPQILTILSLVYTSIFLFPYLLKMWFYPRKASKLPWGGSRIFGTV